MLKARWVGGMNYLHDDYRLMNDYTTTSILAPNNASSMINGMHNNHIIKQTAMRYLAN